MLIVGWSSHHNNTLLTRSGVTTGNLSNTMQIELEEISLLPCQTLRWYNEAVKLAIQVSFMTLAL